MVTSSIEYIRPASRSFAGMKQILFQPFQLGKWVVLGFTAWLAGLLHGGGGNGGSSEMKSERMEKFFREIVAWVKDHSELAIGIGTAILLAGLVLILVFLWISSRGKFLFLDNVVHDRARVKVPWQQFKRHGNSLFRWRFIFGIVAVFTLLPVGGAIAWLVFLPFHDSEWAGSSILWIVLLTVVFLSVMVAIGYISNLLEDFVIPLMYRDSLTTNEAWRHFFQINRAAPGRIILYVLWKYLLGLAAATGMITLGLATCCIGFLLLAIPYLGSVLLLPVLVFFRLLGPEFLRQFGADYDIFDHP